MVDVIDPSFNRRLVVTNENLTTGPVFKGLMVPDNKYEPLGNELTDIICVIGHADQFINDPYQVRNLHDAVVRYGGDINNPLLRGMMECYYSGARDIWLVATGPMSEYSDINRAAPQEALGGQTFYEQYAQRLVDTYNIIEEYDFFDLIVPLYAPFYDAGGVDFLTPLAMHCHNSYMNNGSVRIGIMGTDTEINDLTVSTMATDVRLTQLGVSGRYILVTVGSALYQLPEYATTFTDSLAPAVAAQIAVLALDRGMVYKRLENIMFPGSVDPTPQQVSTLTSAKLNPIGRSAMGRRGQPFQTYLLSDNTLAQTGSDYWSLVQLRLVSFAIRQFQILGRRYIGSSFNIFQDKAIEFFKRLIASGMINGGGSTIKVTRDNFNYYQANVDIVLQPYTSLRQILVSVKVGPGI